MRLPIALTASLLLSLGLNVPVMSQSPVEIPESSAFTSSNVKELIANRRLWTRKNIDSYRYTLSVGCFCTEEARGPVRIEVRNGLTTSITYVNTGKPVTNRELFRRYSTIPKLFNVITDAIARRADSLTVTYDPQYGYPTQINIDYEAQIADEELYLTIEDFQVIE